MKKIIMCLMTIIASTLLCGCPPSLYNYKNIDSERMLQLQQADIDQSVKAVKPLDHWVAKSAEIIVPNQKICQTIIYGKTFMTSNDIVDTLAKGNFINFNGVADRIIKRNLFETAKKNNRYRWLRNKQI
jgi:hypothetical protein